MTEDLNKRVEQAAQGITPQTKPDERRRFLGSLRERCLIRMDNTEVKNPELTALFLKHITDFKGYTILTFLSDSTLGNFTFYIFRISSYAKFIDIFKSFY